jgi:uncharacterized membrane protein YbhN (UPF0104 family)
VLEGGISAEASTTAISAQEARGHARRLRNSVGALVVLFILVGSLLLAVPGLHSIVKRFARVSPAWLGLAVLLELLSGLGYVLVFQLVFSRVQRAFASRLAWAEMAFGAAVPVGGMGSVAIGAWVLCSRGMPMSRIVERSGVLFLLTSVVNAAVLAFFGLGLWVGVFSGQHEPLLSLLPGAAAIGSIAFFLALSRWAPGEARRRGVRGRMVGSLRGLVDIVRATRSALLVRDWRLVGAFGYLLLDIAVLWVCFAAIGNVPPVASLVLAYQIGYLASLLPTPGGVGALDAGLIGMLVLYGANASSATAAVLTYHTIALWVPTLVGTLAFTHMRRQIGLPLERGGAASSQSEMMPR